MDERQARADLRAASGCGGQHDVAAMELDQALDDGEAEPRAAMARPIGAALEAFEDRRLIFGRDAATLILDGEGKLVIFAAAGQHDSVPRTREADGVGEEIIQDLGDPRTVGDEVVKTGLYPDVELDAVLFQPLAKPEHRGVDHTAHFDRRELELEGASIDGGEIKDIVDDGEQRLTRRADVAEIFALLLAQGTSRGARQQLGEADDIGERRAQLIGDVANEGALDAARGLQRLVSVDERALYAFGVGDVAVGQERAAIGKRHRGAGDGRAIRPIEPGLIGAALGEDGGDRSFGSLPLLRVVIERAAREDDIVDMRLAGEQSRAQATDRGEGAVVQAEPPIGPKNRNALGKRVEGLALNMDQRVVAALQGEQFSDVL